MCCITIRMQLLHVLFEMQLFVDDVREGRTSSECRPYSDFSLSAAALLQHRPPCHAFMPPLSNGAFAVTADTLLAPLK